MARVFPWQARIQFTSRDGYITEEGQRWLRDLLEKVAKPAAGLPVYANNAAAKAGGLTVNEMYRTGGDPDLVCVVH